MFGLDEKIAGFSNGTTLLVVVGVSILLGLRHASDPDHLAAVTTLIASSRERAARRAARLGLAWGLGHATSLFVFGLPGTFKGYFVHYSEKITQERNRFTWAILKAHTKNTAGTVRLRSKDARDVPDINFHYFDEGSDGLHFVVVGDGTVALALVLASRDVLESGRGHVRHETSWRATVSVQTSRTAAKSPETRISFRSRL